MSLLSGDFKSVEPDGLKQQMQIEKIQFTSQQDILIWSTKQYYLFNTNGKLLHCEQLQTIFKSNDKVKLFIFLMHLFKYI